MSNFNIANLTAANLQVGDYNHMDSSYQSNIIQWNVLEKEFQKLLEKEEWNVEQLELLREGERSVRQKDKVKFLDTLKRFSSELLFQFSKTALIEIVKNFI